jgi:4-hydroxybenzoate polyprenyltransferase
MVILLIISIHSEKDLINRPTKSMLDRLIGQNTKVVFYFVSSNFVQFCKLYCHLEQLFSFQSYFSQFGFLFAYSSKKLPIVGISHQFNDHRFCSVRHTKIFGCLYTMFFVFKIINAKLTRDPRNIKD